MGQVYRARDTRLGRDVAIKTLPPSVATDAERLARMKREAQLLASLNHPNIAQVYGFEDGPASAGGPALVMELVPGADLAARVAAGPISLAEALPIAQQIAAALEAAHEAGVIHRDLKPANVKVTDDGAVKVLDFGLAKNTAESTEGSGATEFATMTSPAMTAMGMILGTAAYMSPEQAKGRPVDRRADLWAFGCVLYEMLTGRRAFQGDDVTEVLASVIKDAPALDRLPSETPAPIRRLIQRCLQKDRRERLADASTARLEIADAIAGEPGAGTAPVPAAGGRRRELAFVGALVLATLSAALAWILKPAPVGRSAPVARMTVSLPASIFWTRTTGHVLALSPDGGSLAYVANSQIYVRRLDQFEGTAITGTRDPSEPFFSANGEWIGYYSTGSLYKVALAGGPPTPICQTPVITGGFWSADDWVVFSTTDAIWKVRASGGTPEKVIERTNIGRVGSPRLLSDGKLVLYSLAPAGTTWEDGEIVVADLATKQRTTVVKGATDPRYLPGGILVYGRGSDLYAVPFDLQRLKVTAEPTPILNGIGTTVGGVAGGYQYSVSETGTLVYLTGSRLSETQLAWIDRKGNETPITEMAAVQYPRVSPDGDRIAFSGVRAGNIDIYVRERSRNSQSQLTFDPARDMAPIWTPNSQRIVYASSRGGAQNLYWQAADGTGTAERLTTSANDQWPYAMTRDGKTLVYIELSAANSYDTYSLSLEGDRTPKGLLTSAFDERRPSLSPDDKFMVYQSNENGAFEIFVRPFPNVESARWPVSTGGGSSPIWGTKGEIFYRHEQGITRVEVSTSPTFKAHTPVKLIQTDLQPDAQGMSYDVTAEGNMFIVARPAPGRAGPATIEYRVVFNWLDDVRQRLGMKAR
jgi:serine/threonine-protein kinase